MDASPLVLPAGWHAPLVPADNPITEDKFILGRQLFYEKELSGDGKISCGTCHQQSLSFSDTIPGMSGAFGVSNTIRHAPRLVNVAYDSVLFWDGHAHSLEEQAQMALLRPGDLEADTSNTIAKLSNNPAYAALFTNAFGDATVSVDRIAKAIATFVRCLVSGNSAYDQYVNGNQSALSAAALRGMNLFFDTVNHCSECHGRLDSINTNTLGNLFTDNAYYSIGIPLEYYHSGKIDSGREDVSRDSNDFGKFRTPSLRNVGVMGPLRCGWKCFFPHDNYPKL
jgi:cytochrome c peroxidase